MIKCFFTALWLSSATMLMLGSCNRKPDKKPNAVRFEQLLAKAHLNSKDSVRYIIWNSTSCGGCRSYTAQLFDKKLTGSKQVKLIVPIDFASDAQSMNISDLIIDSAGIFNELYFGVDNIGLVDVYNNEVLSIKNYQPDQMDSLQSDLKK